MNKKFTNLMSSGFAHPQIRTSAHPHTYSSANPFSALYGLVIFIRNWAYDRGLKKSYSSKALIISVGNISTGGTGKTPASIWLVGYFLKNGISVAYLSRGYGRKTKGYLEVNPLSGGAERYGDEALMLAHRFPTVPVVVCEKRAEAISILESKVEIIVLDDAFQHRAVKRNLDIVLLDAQRAAHRDSLLPIGRLREPLSSLKRAQLLVFTKLSDKNSILELKREYAVYSKPMLFSQMAFDGLYDFEGKKINLQNGQAAIAFSGLGNNEHFFEQLKSSGLVLYKTFAFRDHYNFKSKDIQEIMASYHSILKNSAIFDSLLIVCSEKDFYRLKATDVFQSILNKEVFAFLRIKMTLLDY